MLGGVPGLGTLGTITLKGHIPSLFIGRELVVTVLSNSKGGKVLVSLFGRPMFVDTTISLKKNQVLHLRVHATNPKVILKPVEQSLQQVFSNNKEIDSLIDKLVGNFKDVPINRFDAKKLFHDILHRSDNDPTLINLAQSLIDATLKFPYLISLLYVPFVDDDSRGRARVAISKDEDDTYTISFDIDTDSLGHIQCNILMKEGLELVITSETEDAYDLVHSHIGELGKRLINLGFNVKRLEVFQSQYTKDNSPSGLDMLV